jgi:hypothetical protein
LFETSKAIQKRNHYFDIAIGSAGTSNVQMIRTSHSGNADSTLLEDSVWNKLLDVKVESADVTKFADKHLLLSQIQVLGAQTFNSMIKKRIAPYAFGSKVSKGDVDFVKEMLALKVDVNSLRVTEGSLLHLAVASSKFDMAKLMMESKADVSDQRNALRQAPLHLAKDFKMSKLLLDHGADADRKDSNGTLPTLYNEAVEQAAATPEKKDDLAVAVAEEKEADAQPEESGVVYDELLSLLMTEKPISTKVDWKFSGKIRLPRQAKVVAN